MQRMVAGDVEPSTATPSFIPPLVQSLNRLKARPEPAGIAFYLIIAFAFLFLAAMPFSAAVQNAVLGKFHLTTQPFGRWATLQFVPSMYNFKNDIFWSFDRIETMDLGPSIPHLAVNHYPLRMLYFTDHRRGLVHNYPLYIYLRSMYRGREVVTVYLLTTRPPYVHVAFLESHDRADR